MEKIQMNNQLHIHLPESPYQCGVDFTLEQAQAGGFIWTGALRATTALSRASEPSIRLLPTRFSDWRLPMDKTHQKLC
jgi:hypothetical protein